MGTAGKSGESVHNDREERQQGTSEERIRLVVLRLPLGHESSKTPEFSAEWMVNQEKQAVQKLLMRPSKSARITVLASGIFTGKAGNY
jgi:hypothetical protein